MFADAHISSLGYLCSDERFLEDLYEAPCWLLLNVFDDANDKLDIWYTLFTSIMNVHAPIVSKRVKNKVRCE